MKKASAPGFVLVLDLIPGCQSLWQAVTAGAKGLPLVEALKLFSKLANPLAAMHSQNIFHCDLSTNNIVLEEGKLDQPHIIDLGMATVNGRKLTTGLEDVACGTPPFLPRYTLDLAAPDHLTYGPIDRTDRALMAAAQDVHALAAIFIYTINFTLADVDSNHPDQVRYPLGKPGWPLQVPFDDQHGTPLPTTLRSFLQKMLTDHPAGKPSMQEVASMFTLMLNCIHLEPELQELVALCQAP
eukprot:jgi/Chrzof1/13591/Cz08g03140.t1